MNNLPQQESLDIAYSCFHKLFKNWNNFIWETILIHSGQQIYQYSVFSFVLTIRFTSFQFAELLGKIKTISSLVF